MTGDGSYRALSLDLWFTTFYHRAEDAAGWEAARARILRKFLVRREGSPLTGAEIDAAARIVGSGLSVGGFGSVTTDPEAVLRAVAAHLGAEVDGPPGEAGRTLSAAGLEEWPPRANPEAEILVRSLEQRGVPSVLVTNSSRRAATWSEFLRARGGPCFRHVVSSSDLGVAKPAPAIFREAARRLDLPPRQVLHVGDSWELDVVGALAAGCGAVLYRGLWDRYPEGLYGSPPALPPKTSGVRVVDHLGSLLDPTLWGD
jgi:HAD superfamily hydrolase (TIGR01509 family)